jgi:hypothetical protein
VCHILKKTRRNIKSYGSAARLDQAIVIKALTSQNSFVGFVLFFFTIPWLGGDPGIMHGLHSW